jgi:hypothetical protein
MFVGESQQPVEPAHLNSYDQGEEEKEDEITRSPTQDQEEQSS